MDDSQIVSSAIMAMTNKRFILPGIKTLIDLFINFFVMGFGLGNNS